MIFTYEKKFDKPLLKSDDGKYGKQLCIQVFKKQGIHNYGFTTDDLRSQYLQVRADLGTFKTIQITKIDARILFPIGWRTINPATFDNDDFDQYYAGAVKETEKMYDNFYQLQFYINYKTVDPPKK